MGANPHPPRRGLRPAFAFAMALILAPLSASAEWWMADPFSPADGDIGSAAAPQRALAGGPSLPMEVGRSSLDRELQCLAKNIYWEAKSESYVGKVAVAAVTLNRVADRRFGNTICAVVSERPGGRCQFTWACDGRQRLTPSGSLWHEALAVAREALHVGHRDPTNGALFFHGVRERTDWRSVRRLVARIGNHVFYR